jgi:hypothetical protein
MLAASSGTRLERSTSSPTGIVNTAPASNPTEISSLISVLPTPSALSSWGAIALPVLVVGPVEGQDRPERRDHTRASRCRHRSMLTGPR